MSNGAAIEELAGSMSLHELAAKIVEIAEEYNQFKQEAVDTIGELNEELEQAGVDQATMQKEIQRLETVVSELYSRIDDQILQKEEIKKNNSSKINELQRHLSKEMEKNKELEKELAVLVERNHFLQRELDNLVMEEQQKFDVKEQELEEKKLEIRKLDKKTQELADLTGNLKKEQALLNQRIAQLAKENGELRSSNNFAIQSLIEKTKDEKSNCSTRSSATLDTQHTLEIASVLQSPMNPVDINQKTKINGETELLSTPKNKKGDFFDENHSGMGSRQKDKKLSLVLAPEELEQFKKTLRVFWEVLEGKNQEPNASSNDLKELFNEFSKAEPLIREYLKKTQKENQTREEEFIWMSMQISELMNEKNQLQMVVKAKEKEEMSSGKKQESATGARKQSIASVAALNKVKNILKLKR